MKKSFNKQVIYAFVCITLAALAKANASTYMYQGKEISKGQALMTLVKDPKAVVQKIDQVQLDLDKGTLKNVKASK